MTISGKIEASGFRGVLFDFHDTLAFADDTTAWVDQCGGALDERMRARVIGALPEVWSRAGERWPGSVWDLDPSEHRKAFIQVLRDDTGCPERLAAELYASMAEQWQLIPGVANLLSHLRSSGHRLGVVSNIAIDIRPTLETWGVLHLFDTVVLSFEAGAVKPDPGIFLIAAQNMGCEPRECLMVGDSPGIDGAANKVGMQALVVPSGDDGVWVASVGALCGLTSCGNRRP